ncbi:uncharacterized protein [Dysidea avara]|uniref:uncharacterized protein isoform X2 n=1 Tax=Dysidea avara TaxID=196820 RepID=UPI0033177CB1
MLSSFFNKPKLVETAKYSIIHSDNLNITRQELGRGSYGTVYAAVLDSKPCVVKEIHPHFNTSEFSDLHKEINTLASLKHPNIVQFFGVYFRSKSTPPILVMERMWKSLSNLLEERPNQLTLLIKTHILYDVACGLQYLHGQKKPVVHRNLKASKILLTENMDAKISDLGQSKALKKIAGQMFSRTPDDLDCMPPEASEEKSVYDSKLDIFSFGCTIIHLVIEQFPTPTARMVLSDNSTNLYVKASETDRRKQFLDLMDSISVLLRQIADQCLQNEPSNRPTASFLCKRLEEELTSKDKEYKQDKLSLLLSLQKAEVQLGGKEDLGNKTEELLKKKEEEITKLGQELQELNQNKRRDEEEKMSLQEQLKEVEKQLKRLKDECAEKESLLKKELEEKDKELNKSRSVIKDSKIKYADLCKKHEELEQQSMKRQKQQAIKKASDPDTKLHQHLLELQSINETKHHELQQQKLKYTEIFKTQAGQIASAQAENADLQKKFGIQKQQLEDKSNRLNTLESFLYEVQKVVKCKEENLKVSEEECATLKMLLENNNEKCQSLQSILTSKENSLKQKDDDIHMVKKRYEDELNQLHVQYKRQIKDLTEDVEMYKSLAVEPGEVGKLLQEETRYKSENTEENVKKLECDLKNTATVKAQKMLKTPIENQEFTIKKYIEQLEKKSLKSTSPYFYNINWCSYVSLPVNRIRPCAVIIKDKVFITGGYEQVSPQDEDLDSYLKSLKRGNEVFCFHTTKCRCDSIASPVMLGGVASVNGQCVLVSGAEGNTLTGNVYVLREEGSDKQWKKFSEPVPTPRILPCVCCYGERWMIVCGGYACKEGSNLLEAVSVVEILDTSEGEWHKLSEEQCPKVLNILCCTVIGKGVHIIGDSGILKCSLSQLIAAATKRLESSVSLWSEIVTRMEDMTGNLYPFSIVDVNGEPMIIASISGSEGDVTCVLMKDTTDTWRKMSEAVECQHCSAVVVTPTLELLLFGGSEKVSVGSTTNKSQKGTLIASLSLHELNAVSLSRKGTLSLQDPLVTISQLPAVPFTGPVHSQQFDHNGGIFQSPVHKVSIVVPPNAIDGEKVTVHMGATTSGPFDLPEDCNLRSAVVWLGSESDVVLKRSIAVVVPHSAVFTSPQHCSMMRFLTCEDSEGPRYKFKYSQNQFEIDEKQGWIEVNKLNFVMVAIVASSEGILEDKETIDEEHVSHDNEFSKKVEFLGTPQAATSSISNHQGRSPKRKTVRLPSVQYIAKLFQPCSLLPSSFRIDVHCLQNLPTELHKIDEFRKAYYEDNGAYPEIVETKFMIDGDGTELKCVLPCSGSSECDCLSGWSVTQINVEKDATKTDLKSFSFKFDCQQPKANLRCCFEFEGANRILNATTAPIPSCLEKRYQSPNLTPFIMICSAEDAHK